MLAQRPRQPDRVLERELGAGADREVRRVRGVAEQHDVLVVPGRVADGHEVDPARVVADQAVAVERVGEQLLAERDARGVALARRQRARAVEPRAPPGLLRGLHDERAHRVAVRIAVDLEDAVLGLGDEELEGVEHELGAEPHVLRAARVQRRPERGLVAGAHRAVDAVGADDQVRVGELGRPASVLKCSCTPSAAARCWSASSSARRLSAEKPWPPEVTTSPR